MPAALGKLHYSPSDSQATQKVMLICALCSQRVTSEVKTEIASILSQCDPADDYADSNVCVTGSTRLLDFLDAGSRFMFDELKICKTTRLQLPVAE